MTQFNGKPLRFVKYASIENKNPQFISQTTMLDFGRYLAIWYVESDDKYYMCIG